MSYKHSFWFLFLKNCALVAQGLVIFGAAVWLVAKTAPWSLLVLFTAILAAGLTITERTSEEDRR